MVKILLIRHGQTEWNLNGRYQGQSDVALSQKGIAQAQALAEYFPVEQLDAVYSSDLQRARVTAEIVAQKFHLPVQLEPAFRELSFGDWEGLTYEQIVEGWSDAMANFLKHPDKMQIPHGETFADVQKRAFNRFQELVREHEPQDHTLAIFAHGAVLRTLLTAILHMSLEYVWELRQYNTAVNIVRYDDGWPTVELLNSTEHLRRNSLKCHCL